MSNLDQELFGTTSDSDESGSEDQGSVDWEEEADDDDDDETDPIFQSIMNSTPLEDENDHDPVLNVVSITPRHEPHPYIPGLTLHANILTDEDQARLMAQITEKNFFKGGQQNQAMCFGKRDLAWLDWLVGRMTEGGVLDERFCEGIDSAGGVWTHRQPLFDQSIMNLYYPGNGIKPHVDLARFEDGIVIISLLAAINMDFYPARVPMSADDPPEGRPPLDIQSSIDPTSHTHQQRKPSFTVRLQPGSIISMQGPARYAWEHGIQETTQDEVKGELIQRKIRVSVTLRKMRTGAWRVGTPGTVENGVADRRD
ncbi:hypothetical protein EDD11_005375 [Mortierella claussenii]|nr:hypothetical protein EDD11_005375 [Mortierella claussenii]